MPKTAALHAGRGDVIETVTQERVIPADEQKDSDPTDAFEYMESISPDELANNNWTITVYQLYPPVTGRDPGKPMYLEKFPITAPFDEAAFQQRFGGGEYRFHVKRGSERKRVGTFRGVGDPKPRNGDGAPVATVTTNGTAAKPTPTSEAVQLAQLILERNPQAAGMEMLRTAFNNALEVQKSASAAAVFKPTDMIELMKVIQTSAASPPPAHSEMPDWLKQVLAAAIPAGVALITKALTPTDAMTTLTQMQQVIGVAKTLSTNDAAAPKPDIGVEIIRNAPGLLSEGTKFLAELRAAAQLRIQSEMLARPAHNPAPVVPAVHAAPAMPAAPAAPTVASASPPAPGEVHGRPSPEYILGRVCEKIERGETGGEVLWFIDEYDSAFVDQMKAASMDDLRNFILLSPILGRLKDHPRLEPFLKELYEALHEADPKAPLPN